MNFGNSDLSSVQIASVTGEGLFDNFDLLELDVAESSGSFLLILYDSDFLDVTVLFEVTSEFGLGGLEAQVSDIDGVIVVVSGTIFSLLDFSTGLSAASCSGGSFGITGLSGFLLSVLKIALFLLFSEGFGTDDLDDSVHMGTFNFL